MYIKLWSGMKEYITISFLYSTGEKERVLVHQEDCCLVS